MECNKRFQAYTNVINIKNKVRLQSIYNIYVYRYIFNFSNSDALTKPFFYNIKFTW